MPRLPIRTVAFVCGVTAHRVTRDHRAVGIGPELFAHPDPDFPDIELALVEIPARRPRASGVTTTTPAVADLVQQARIDGGELVLAQGK